MLGLRDNLTLSLTKLRTRRIRLITTLIVAGILFTVLVSASMIVRGSVQSFQNFVKTGLLNRFIVSTFELYDYGVAQDPKFIARVEELDKARLAAQATEAKRLGLPFDAKTAPRSIEETTLADGTKRKDANMAMPASRQAFLEAHPDTTVADLTKRAAPYHPIALYQRQIFAGYTNSSADFAPILNSKEIANNNNGFGGLTDAFTVFKQTFSGLDNGLLKPFLLKDATLDTQPGQPLPIIMPTDAAEKLLGLSPLKAKAAPSERLERLAKLREAASRLTLDVCYRNGAAMNLREKARQQATEITTQANQPGYQKPSLIYTEPAGVCQPTTIKTDTRTTEEKALAAKQAAFDKTFGATEPVTQLIRFRVVGITPQIGSMFEASGPESIITSFFTSTIGDGWFTSRQAAQTNPILAGIMADPYQALTGGRSQFIEFPDRATEKRFLEEQACSLNVDPVSCTKRGKVSAQAFGNPLAALYEVREQMNDFLTYTLLIIGALCTIVMMGTIGKIIADNRKETSVFRALGAKRHDIAQIYLAYTAILATLSYLIALGLGLAIALYVEAAYSPDISVQAVLAFNSADLHKAFHLIGFNALDLLAIYGFALAISLAAASVPIASSLTRNPIKDMRED